MVLVNDHAMMFWIAHIAMGSDRPCFYQCCAASTKEVVAIGKRLGNSAQHVDLL